MQGTSAPALTFNLMLGTLFLPAVFVLAISSPYVLVYAFPAITPKIINFLFAMAQRDFALVSMVAVVAALSLYWLKLQHQAIYGVLELFIAQLTIATAIVTLSGTGSKTATLLQMFSGIYITIRGLDNIEKCFKSSVNSETMQHLRSEFLAEDVVGTRTLFLILSFFLYFYALQYSFILFLVGFMIHHHVQMSLIARIKKRRPIAGSDAN